MRLKILITAADAKQKALRPFVSESNFFIIVTAYSACTLHSPALKLRFG